MPKVRIVDFLFVLILFLIIVDLNGFVSLYTKSTGTLSFLILGIALILLLFSFRFSIRTPSLSIYLVFLFVFWLVIGSLILYTKSGSLDLDKIRKYIPSILLVILFSRIFMFYYQINQLNRIINFITLTLLLNVVIVIYSYYSGAFLSQRSSYDRSSGFIASVNQAGVTTILAQVFLLFKFLSANSKRNGLFLVAYFLSLYATFLTFSKAAYLSSLTLILLFLLILKFFPQKEDIVKHLKWKRNKSFVFLGIPIIAVFLLFNGNDFSLDLTRNQVNRLMEFDFFLKGEINEETTTGRTTILSHSFQEIENNNYLGGGLGSFHNLPKIGGSGTHNEFVLFLGELGIIGFVLYLAYFVMAYFQAILLKDPSMKFLVLGLINTLFLVSLVSHSVLFIKTYIIIFSLINSILFLSKPKNVLLD